MRKRKSQCYDLFLTVSGISLIILYVYDPYYKLGYYPQYKITKSNPADDRISIQDSIQDEPKEPERQPKDRTLPSLPDVRSENCVAVSRNIKGKASIIINVAKLTHLKPTLKSLAVCTPGEYIQEVIAVDQGDLGPKDMAELEKIVKENIANGSVVKNDGNGHVSARLKAAKEAQGEMLIFLETGSLVSPGWIEPILDLLSKKKKTFVVPHFDKVSDDVSFGYIHQKNFQVPMIDRDLTIKMLDMPSKAEEEVVAVGSIRRECFAVSAVFFRDIGMLDREVGDHGGVHQELSLRLWQCEGSIHMATCSNVALMTLSNPLRVSKAINKWKINEMWIKSKDWDPFYNTLGDKKVHVNDMAKKSINEKMSLLKLTLQCKADISDYIDKFLPAGSTYDLKPSSEDIAFQKKLKAVVPGKKGVTGLLRSVSTQQCLSPDKDRILRLGPCDPDKAGVPRSNMTFKYTINDKLRVNGRCVTVARHDYLRVMDCDSMNEVWNYWEQQKFDWAQNGTLFFFWGRDCVVNKHPIHAQGDRPVALAQMCNIVKANKQKCAKFELLV